MGLAICSDERCTSQGYAFTLSQAQTHWFVCGLHFYLCRDQVGSELFFRENKSTARRRCCSISDD
jgi:hypothetical protein